MSAGPSQAKHDESHEEQDPFSEYEPSGQARHSPVALSDSPLSQDSQSVEEGPEHVTHESSHSSHEYVPSVHVAEQLR